VGEPIRRMIVICPKCGEDNADSFRFCGMCGALLETRRPVSALVLDPLSAFPPSVPPLPSKIPDSPEPQRPQLVGKTGTLASRAVPPITGPSMLGLDQSGANQASPKRASPSIDSLREKSFSGLDSFLEPEQPKTGRRRMLLMVILLAALGGAAWWTYTNYLGAAEGRKPVSSAGRTTNATDENPAMPSVPAAQHARPRDADPAQVTTPSPSAAVPAGPSENVTASPDPSRKSQGAGIRTGNEPSAITRPARRGAGKTSSVYKNALKHEPTKSSVRPSSPASAAADTGEAAFRKGEAYLYGRGAAKNCDEAVKNLKAAAKSNAKARSAFGTMYATGHCVPRDLPTSYQWFALALRVDPNNQILVKDLNAIWNQMTPPERQTTTRMKE
jgi:zinc-ribbon domain